MFVFQYAATIVHIMLNSDADKTLALVGKQICEVCDTAISQL